MEITAAFVLLSWRISFDGRVYNNGNVIYTNSLPLGDPILIMHVQETIFLEMELYYFDTSCPQLTILAALTSL